MVIFLEEIVLVLCLWLLKVVDVLEEIFNSLTGITNIVYNGEEINLIELLLYGSSTITTVFWSIFIIAIGLGAIFTITSLIRNMLNAQKNVSTIVGKFCLSIVGTMLMVAVVIVGISLANSILILLSKAMNFNDSSLSAIILDACTMEYVGEKGSWCYQDLDSLSASSILGDYDTSWFFWPKSWKNNGIANADSFSYVFCLMTCIIMMIFLVKASLTLAKRVYEIVILYMTMPLSMSTISLDDGARFKVWRETIIGKVVMAYGAVMGINVFFLVTPIVTKVSLLNVSSSLANGVLRLFLILGGASVINMAMNMFTSLFGGSGAASGGGGGGVHGFIMSAGAITRGARGIARGVTHGAGRLAKGGMNIANKAYRSKMPKTGGGGGSHGYKPSGGSSGGSSGDSSGSSSGGSESSS